MVADAWAFERDVNPDREVGNEIVDSNPVDVLIDRGRAVMADAGGNSIIRTGHKGRLEALAVFPNVHTPSPFGTIPMQAVPTGVVKGPDGFYYVSQLTGFPFPIGGAKVFRVNPSTGSYTTYATGFTNIIDLDFGRDGTLYVLELDSDSIIAARRGVEGRRPVGRAEGRQAEQGRAAGGHADRAGRDRGRRPRQALRVQSLARGARRRGAAHRSRRRSRPSRALG